jgi:hypothetical protein
MAQPIKLNNIHLCLKCIHSVNLKTVYDNMPEPINITICHFGEQTFSVTGKVVECDKFKRKEK